MIKRWYKRPVTVFRPSVLFMGTTNTTRTQMAEALLRHHAGDRFEVHSAGLEAGEIHPHTLTVLMEIGVSVAGLHPRALKDHLGTTYHHLITLSEEGEAPPIFPGVSTRLDWNVSRPRNAPGDADPLNPYRVVRNQLDLQIHHFLMDHHLFKLGIRAT